jgi:type I restriction-modification system DNA methylase subunit
MANHNNGNNDKSLEQWLWDAACSIRGAKDAPKYKDYILPLVFTKRLCDVFDDEINRIANHGKLWKTIMRAHLGDYERLESRLKERVV